jgi:hypothetical protein
LAKCPRKNERWVLTRRINVCQLYFALHVTCVQFILVTYSMCVATFPYTCRLYHNVIADKF